MTSYQRQKSRIANLQRELAAREEMLDKCARWIENGRPAMDEFAVAEFLLDRAMRRARRKLAEAMVG